MSFNDKVVLVTGGSSGIGATTAIEFAAQGAKVVIVGRDEKKLNEVAKKCNNPVALVADITKENDLKSVVEETINHFGKLDILINNAGMVSPAGILSENAMEVFDRVMNINLRSAVYLTHLAAPHIIKTKGNIVNISSTTSSFVLFKDSFAYNTSKAAMDHFTRSVAAELASSGVRVNSVNPGPVKTKGIENASRTKPENDAVLAWLKNVTALKRISDPKEITDVILFLASEKAKGITGSIFVSDNGALINAD